MFDIADKLFFSGIGLFLLAVVFFVYKAAEEDMYRDKLYRTAYSDCVAAGNTTYYCYEKLKTNKFTSND